ncbi:MAG: hypothetical protein OXU25_01830 [Thaumarchaeota archaeon]|nr:hypothetical protein [Nitrososphaerota archaeon]
MMALDYFEFLLQGIYRQIDLQKWSIEGFRAKAGTTISTGAVVLSITTVSMAGFIALLSRTGLDAFSLLESLFGMFAALAICLAIIGIFSIIGSMIVSIHALRGRPIAQILDSNEFELVEKSDGRSAPDESRRMSSEEVAYRLQRNAVDTMRTLEGYISWIAPKIHLGQILLLLGIGLMAAVLVIGLVWALLSRVPA